MRTFIARRARARLLVALYLWAFPLLAFSHGDAAHHARLPACNGFAWEHRTVHAGDGPVFLNLHVLSGGDTCAVCALARSATLASPPVVATAPAAPRVTSCALADTPRAARSSARLARSRAPPIA